MASIFVERAKDPSTDLVPMLYVTVEAPDYGADGEAQLSFETERGFSFRIRVEDAAELARLISDRLAGTSD